MSEFGWRKWETPWIGISSFHMPPRPHQNEGVYLGIRPLQSGSPSTLAGPFSSSPDKQHQEVWYGILKDAT
ncbi:hypothetical protein LINPERPRIM_LOCUS19118 [Linum perenne]